jgi:aspartate/methionine/tyrosine aminotransferase
MIHCLAQELNSTLSGTTPGSFLSDLGERIYFPKGIIAQSAEAKKLGKKANATIGMTLKDGKPVVLPSVQKEFPGFSATEIVAYETTSGNQAVRELWKTEIVRKNPLLANKSFSLPVVVPGLTAGISIMCDMFLPEGETLLLANPSWDNYALVAEARRNAHIGQFELFRDGKIDIASLKAALRKEAKTGKVRILLNFPQNPSGYSPLVSEAAQIIDAIRETAENGCKVFVISDDAYFGFAYEDGIEKQSLFAYLADLHENVFAVKIDGPTKEDYVWGLRCGFLTFAGKGLTEAHYDALIKKLMGLIRSSVSCSTTISQSLVSKIYAAPDLPAQKAEYFTMLKRRYQKVRAFVDEKKGHPVLEALPFNSGYFMSFRCNGINAEALRVKLLEERQIGTIAIDVRTLRIAFASIDEDLIDAVYTEVYAVAEKLRDEK